MKIIIHDLRSTDFEDFGLKTDINTMVIADNGKIRPCIGCFGCWVKTPGTCVLKDGYENMGELLSVCEELIIISKCIYGSYSPFVRNILDRSISYLLPYFKTKNGETHHRNRYNNHVALSVHFYGEDITEAEKKTAENLVAANSVNFYTTGNQVYFHSGFQKIREVL